MKEPLEHINVFHGILLFITSVGLINHVTIIPSLAESAGKDSWISVILTLGVTLFWIILIYMICKKTEQRNLYLWLQEHIGSLFAKIFSLLLIIFLCVLIAATLYDLVIWTKISYLTTTPKLVIVTTYIFLCFCLALTNIRTIAMVNILLLPWIILFGLFVMTANMPNKDYSLLTPILDKGFEPVFQGMIYSGAGQVEILLILLFQHRIKTRIKYWHLAVTSIFLAGLSIGPLTGGIAAFGLEEMMKMRFPAYQQWTLVTLGRYIEHLDFFSIYQWLSGAFIRISLGLFLIVDYLNLPKGKKRMLPLGILSLLFIGLLHVPITDMQFVNFLHRYYLPGSLLFFFFISLLLFIAIFLKKGGSSHYEQVSENKPIT
ncbi:endospore germination permease [Alteribacillus sp. HJP-4]|uniref:endospore germination permease n=1 Tax=Alteribacillus sp. HJP-4 TaxID=2775394 RepID=UPI0035CD2F3C